MVGLVPNIYLLQYLKSNAKVRLTQKTISEKPIQNVVVTFGVFSQEEPVLEKKAKEYMEIGYNRQQKYRHPDGAYSIWGKGDEQCKIIQQGGMILKSMFSEHACSRKNSLFLFMKTCMTRLKNEY